MLLGLRLPARPGARAAVGRAGRAVAQQDRAAAAQRGAGAGAARRRGPRSLADIYRHGGGNPFYLEQLARASEEGRPLAGPASNGDREAGVPAAVAAALAEELESLSPRARALLDAAAVAGEPFEPDLAAAVAELSQAEGLAALDDLLAVDLVRPTQVPRRFVFRHPLVRNAVYESTRGGWRLAAHGRAAAALATRGAAAGERAHHVEQSAGQGDEDAIGVLIQAGAEAAGRGPGRGGALVRGGAPAAARGRPRAPGGPAGVAGVGAALARRARALSRDAAGGERPPARGLGGTARGAHHALRRGRALAGPPRGGASASGAGVGGASRPGHHRIGGAADRAGGGRSVRARLRPDLRDGARGARDRPGALRPAPDRGRGGGARARRGLRRPDRVCARAPERGARADRPALQRRAGAAPGGALLPRLDRQLPRALPRGDRARRPWHRDRAGHRARAGC